MQVTQLILLAEATLYNSFTRPDVTVLKAASHRTYSAPPATPAAFLLLVAAAGRSAPLLRTCWLTRKVAANLWTAFQQLLMTAQDRGGPPCTGRIS